MLAGGKGRHSQLINNERRYKNWKESIPTLLGTDEAYGEDDQFAFRQQSVVSNSQVKYESELQVKDTDQAHILGVIN